MAFKRTLLGVLLVSGGVLGTFSEFGQEDI